MDFREKFIVWRNNLTLANTKWLIMVLLYKILEDRLFHKVNLAIDEKVKLAKPIIGTFLYYFPKLTWGLVFITLVLVWRRTKEQPRPMVSHQPGTPAPRMYAEEEVATMVAKAKQEARKEAIAQIPEPEKMKGITTSMGEPLGKIRLPMPFERDKVNIFTVDKGRKELIEIRDKLIKYSQEGNALFKEGKEQMTIHTLEEWTKQTNDYKKRVTVYLRNKVGPPAAVLLDDPTETTIFPFITKFGDEHNENLSSLNRVLFNLLRVLLSLRATVG